MPISAAEGSRPAGYIEAHDLTAGYGEVAVVSGLEFTVAKGEIVSIVGPNGSGKSTALKALVGILPLMSGRIVLGGEDIQSARVQERARLGVGYVAQTHYVFEGLTVEENLRLGAYRLDKSAVKSRIEEILEQYSTLAPLLRRPAQKLSGGEQKLVAIARVMMTRPSVYVLDEPASSLSAPVAERLFREHVVQLAQSGAAVLLVEQKARLALEISDWAYLLVRGQVKMSAPASSMLNDRTAVELFFGGGSDDAKARRTVGSDTARQRS